MIQAVAWNREKIVIRCSERIARALQMSPWSEWAPADRMTVCGFEVNASNPAPKMFWLLDRALIGEVPIGFKR